MPFGALWLPVVASTVVVFILSSVMHAVLKYHKKDFAQFPDEDALAQAVAKQNLAPGQYMAPFCGDGSKFKDPAFQERWMKGPNFLLVMGPSGKLTMGKSLGQWALNCFIVSFMTAYVARHAHLEGAAAIEIARITGTVAIMGYTLATMTESIWKWRPWSSTFLVLMDGVIYGLGTAACFALLWPSGS